MLAEKFLFAAEAFREQPEKDPANKEQEEKKGSEDGQEEAEIQDPATDTRPQRIRAYRSDKQVAWEIAADGRGDLIQAGTRLYAAGPQQIVAIDLPRGSAGKPTVAWKLPVEGRVQRLLAGGDRLFAVTAEGRIMAFGAATEGTAKALAAAPLEVPRSSP